MNMVTSVHGTCLFYLMKRPTPLTSSNLFPQQALPVPTDGAISSETSVVSVVKIYYPMASRDVAINGSNPMAISRLIAPRKLEIRPIS